MQPGGSPIHHSIVVLDIEKFGNPGRSDLHRKIAHNGLYLALDTALHESEIDPRICSITDRGDGALILVPDTVPGGRLVDHFPLRLNANLLRHNAGCSAEARIRLRMSLHRGDARMSDNGIVGDAVNFACRLVDADGIRQAQGASGELISIIVSDLFYRDVVRNEPAARPDLYREVAVQVKEVDTTAWVRFDNDQNYVSPVSQTGWKERENFSASPRRRRGDALGEKVGDGILWPLVQALSAVPSLASIAVRDQLVHSLRERLRRGFPDSAGRYLVGHLFDIVAMCAEHPDGLPTLLEVLAEIEPDSSKWSHVREVVQEMTALDLWVDTDRQRLFDLLAGAVVPEIVEIYRSVAGNSTPRLRSPTSYPEMFEALERLNAHPSGVPRPLVFVEHVAARVHADLAAELRRWSADQAEKMDLQKELEEIRRAVLGNSATIVSPPQNSRAYVVIQIQNEGPSGDLYRLSHWCQLVLSPGWSPVRGEDVTGDMESIKRHVAVVIERAEADWALYRPEIRIEFLLAYENLDLDVEQWPWETDSQIPESLGCRYTVAIRSLERMTLVKYHGTWHKRWASLRAQVDSYGAIPPLASRSGKSSGAGGLRELMADFNLRREVVALVLSEPPQRRNAGQDEVAVAIRAGLPVIAWFRDPDPPQEFFTAIDQLLHGVDDTNHLLERVRRARNSAFERGPEGRHFGARLALLYDDPSRVVVPAQPEPPEGESMA